MTKPLPRPYEGLTVLDLTHVLAGPFSAYQLGLLGARVIKIENPDDPDQTRTHGPAPELNAQEMGVTYLTQASNKLSLTLDIKKPEGIALLKRMAASADVFVENYRPGSLDALGLGADELMKANPRLIYCSISAYGQDGPKGSRTAYDSVIQASSGIMAMNGTPQVHPVMIKGALIDYATGMSAAFAMASALFQRERTGVGQRIDLAMEDVGLMLMSNYVTGYLYNGKEVKPTDIPARSHTGDYYPTRDGLLMITSGNHRQQRRLWTVLGHPELAEGLHTDEHDAILRPLLLTRTADEWEEFFQANHVPASRVRSMPEAVADSQLEHRTILHRFTPEADRVLPVAVPTSPFIYAHGGGPAVDFPPPVLGADTDRVLHDFGLADAEIAALRNDGVIG